MIRPSEAARLLPSDPWPTSLLIVERARLTQLIAAYKFLIYTTRAKREAAVRAVRKADAV